MGSRLPGGYCQVDRSPTLLGNDGRVLGVCISSSDGKKFMLDYRSSSSNTEHKNKILVPTQED